MAMRLNHIDLPITDLAAAVHYFVTGFGFTPQPTAHAGMAILRADDGFVLVLQQDSEARYPSSFHVGFLQPNDEAVHAVYRRLTEAELPVPAPPANSYGALAFFCMAPGGIRIEVSHRPA
jgi:catechol-2,3-dioxygenase